MEVFKLKVNGKVIERHYTQHQELPDRSFDAMCYQLINLNVDADVTLTYSAGFEGDTITLRTQYLKSERYEQVYGADSRYPTIDPDCTEHDDMRNHKAHPSPPRGGDGFIPFATQTIDYGGNDEWIPDADAEYTIPPGKCECGKDIGHE